MADKKTPAAEAAKKDNRGQAGQVGSAPSSRADRHAQGPWPEQNEPHPRVGRYPFRARYGQQDQPFGADHRRARVTPLQAGRFRPAFYINRVCCQSRFWQ